jgi:hypothetical protein
MINQKKHYAYQTATARYLKKLEVLFKGGVILVEPAMAFLLKTGTFGIGCSSLLHC